ncbi:hypothetical protein ENBRE01_0134 [Enteropsectra breve]|nr:hypothetical protein ENBRE01_0134 [Enteropsectra breve]
MKLGAKHLLFCFQVFVKAIGVSSSAEAESSHKISLNEMSAALDPIKSRTLILGSTQNLLVSDIFYVYKTLKQMDIDASCDILLTNTDSSKCLGEITQYFSGPLKEIETIDCLSTGEVDECIICNGSLAQDGLLPWLEVYEKTYKMIIMLDEDFKLPDKFKHMVLPVDIAFINERGGVFTYDLMNKYGPESIEEEGGVLKLKMNSSDFLLRLKPEDAYSFDKNYVDELISNGKYYLMYYNDSDTTISACEATMKIIYLIERIKKHTNEKIEDMGLLLGFSEFKEFSVLKIGSYYDIQDLPCSLKALFTTIFTKPDTIVFYEKDWVFKIRTSSFNLRFIFALGEITPVEYEFLLLNSEDTVFSTTHIDPSLVLSSKRKLCLIADDNFDKWRWKKVTSCQKATLNGLDLKKPFRFTDIILIMLRCSKIYDNEEEWEKSVAGWLSLYDEYSSGACELSSFQNEFMAKYGKYFRWNGNMDPSKLQHN